MLSGSGCVLSSIPVDIALFAERRAIWSVCISLLHLSISRPLNNMSSLVWSSQMTSQVAHAFQFQERVGVIARVLEYPYVLASVVPRHLPPIPTLAKLSGARPVSPALLPALSLPIFPPSPS